MKRLLRLAGSYLTASMLALSVGACCLYAAVMESAVDKEIYQRILDRDIVQNKIDGIIVNSTGLWQLKPLDEELYGKIFYMLRKEVADPFLAGLPLLWTSWLGGKTNAFDPVMDLSVTRGKIIWLFKQTVKSRLPEMLVNKFEQRIERNFSKKVPSAMRMLPLIGVSSNMERWLSTQREDFLSMYSLRYLVWLIPVVFAGLWVWSMRQRRHCAESLAGVVGGISLFILMPILLFSRQIAEIAGTIVRLKSGASEWAEMADVAVAGLVDRLIIPLAVLALISITVLLVLVGIRWWRRRSFV